MEQLEVALAKWFTDHHGVIDRGHALDIGTTYNQIRKKVRSGAWVQVHAGVYRLASVPLTPLVQLQAAVLLGGQGTVVSHGSAAWLHGLRDFPPDQPTITVPRGRVVRAKGVRAVRSRHHASGHRQQGLVCTDVPRTILDCAGDLRDDDLDDLVDVALATRRTRLDNIAKMASSPGLSHHPGRARLRRRLEARGLTGSPSPSVLESRMARLFKRFNLPAAKPQLEVRPNGRYVLDYAYPTVRLVVEVDGRFDHGKIDRQRHDRRRDAELQAAGWMVLHYDWWQVTFESDRVAQEIKAHYDRRRAAAAA